MEASIAIITTPSLIVKPAEGELVSVYDFLTKNCAHVSIHALYWFNYFAEAQSFGAALATHPEFTPEELDQELGGLIVEGFLVVEGSERHTEAQTFKTSWGWDITSALFHFTILNNPFATSSESTAIQAAKASHVASPVLHWRNGEGGEPLPRPGSHIERSVFDTMVRRRTNRNSTQETLTAGEIGDCLFAGLGITGFVHAPLGMLPLSMTPSGGARNPYEAYVIVRSARDVRPGVYHYSAQEHSLALLSHAPPNEVASLFASQEWIETAPVIIVLVAVFERTMWKYPDPNAYRVAMIEAGHIGQNIMLAATSMGLTACPTAALSHDPLAALFEVKGMTHAPVYALSLAHAAQSDDVVVPNGILFPSVSRVATYQQVGAAE